jgi:hypothetical protein
MGSRRYYFTETTGHNWADVTAVIAKIAHAAGALPTAEVEKLSLKRLPRSIRGLHCSGAVIVAVELTGWKHVGPTIYESLPDMVEAEIKSLGTQSATTTFDPKK